MRFSLSELLAEVGDENLRFQVLVDSLEGNQSAVKGGGSRLSFRTEEPLTAAIDGTRMALVVWMDKEASVAAMNRLLARPAAGPGQ